MGHFQVGSVVSSNPGVIDLGLTCLLRKIMEMQCELLISSFQNPKAIALVKENIGHISDGSSSHCPGALKLGLKKDASRWKEVEIDGCIWSDHLVEYSAL